MIMSLPLRPSAGRPLLGVPEDNAFGQWLRGERVRRGWTGEHLASLIGETMKQGRISAYERGDKKPEEETALVIADALATGLDDVARASLRRQALRFLIADKVGVDMGDVADANTSKLHSLIMHLQPEDQEVLRRVAEGLAHQKIAA